MANKDEEPPASQKNPNLTETILIEYIIQE